MARILIADGDILFCGLLEKVLRLDGHKIHAAGSLSALDSAVREIPGPDLVLVDLRLPGMNGLERFASAVAAAACPVALVAGPLRFRIAREASALGAAGTVSKSLALRDFTDALDQLLAGMPVILTDPDVTGPPAATPDELTVREHEVITLVAAGWSNREVAERMGLRETTVKLHLKTLSGKLGARNRTHAAVIARDKGLI